MKVGKKYRKSSNRGRRHIVQEILNFVLGKREENLSSVGASWN